MIRTAFLSALILALTATSARAEGKPQPVDVGLSGILLMGIVADAGDLPADVLEAGDGLPLATTLEVNALFRGIDGSRWSAGGGLGLMTGFDAFQPKPQLRLGVSHLFEKPGDGHLGIALALNAVYRVWPGYGDKDIGHQVVGILSLLFPNKSGGAVIVGVGPAHNATTGVTAVGFSVGYGQRLSTFEIE